MSDKRQGPRAESITLFAVWSLFKRVRSQRIYGRCFYPNRRRFAGGDGSEFEFTLS